MLSKNNHNLKIKQASDRQLRFSLRKFGTGIASVAIASLFFIGSSAMTVHADTNDGSTSQFNGSINYCCRRFDSVSSRLCSVNHC
ncbi:YSIRK-type signal peptide-containing protein [Limosilactobacillus mucosae]|uniref:YSIRK-type signal peptide-containing protein n=1 Tax=Limosilactobacillus mucosae TaxID=97478 RepID=UPI003826F17C